MTCSPALPLELELVDVENARRGSRLVHSDPRFCVNVVFCKNTRLGKRLLEHGLAWGRERVKCRKLQQENASAQAENASDTCNPMNLVDPSGFQQQQGGLSECTAETISSSECTISVTIHGERTPIQSPGQIPGVEEVVEDIPGVGPPLPDRDSSRVGVESALRTDATWKGSGNQGPASDKNTVAPTWRGGGALSRSAGAVASGGSNGGGGGYSVANPWWEDQFTKHPVRTWAVGTAVGTLAILAALEIGGGMAVAGTTQAGSATNAANAGRLGKALASEAGMAELLGGGGSIIAGVGHKTPIRDVPRLVAEYGGRVGDWAKMSSAAHKLYYGATVEAHAYKNVITGQVVELKSKVASWIR